VATEIVIPMLGVTVEKGQIVEWLKKEGDTVEKGESIFAVEADKVATEVEAPASGILAKILLTTGIEVPVLTVVGVITQPGETLPEKYQASTPVSAAPAAPQAVQTPCRSAVSAPATTARPAGPVMIIPAARKRALESGLDLDSLSGTGPQGVVTFSDVQQAMLTGAGQASKASSLARKLAESSGASLDAIQGSGVRGRIMTADVTAAVDRMKKPGLGKVIPMDNMRRTIARRMSQSAFSAPHIYFFTDICMDPVLSLRKQTLPDFEARFGLKISVNDFIIKAVALNLVDFPILNATFKEEEIHICPQINVCLAVALDVGLIVPALADTDSAGLADIAAQRTDLVARARRGALSREELERGTFTVSSLAQYDITFFTAILNPPQSGILSVGKTRQELYMINGEVKERNVATFGLSVDHRIIDGAVAADFLQHLKSKLENAVFTFLNT